MINDRNRSRVFLAIIAILLIANFGILAFFLQKKGVEKPVERLDKKTLIANFLQKEIGFDQEQLKVYDTLGNRHREKINKLFESIRNNKTIQLKQLAAVDFADSAISRVAEQSTGSQKTIEIEMLNYIKSIRLLSTPEQRPKFDSLFIKVFNKSREPRKK